MKRHGSSPNCRFVTLRLVAGVAALWQVLSVPLSAQQSTTIESAPTKPSWAVNAATANPPVAASLDATLTQVRTAIQQKQYHVAVESFRVAASAPQKSTQQLAALAQLRSQLHQIGIDSALLNMPPQQASSAVKRLPDMVGAKPIATAAAAPSKQQALRLIAQGRAALDRGDVAAAVGFAHQAQALKVPEQEFAPGEPRVWQLVLDAESAARRGGIALTSGTTVSDDVQPALGGTAGNPLGVVQQTLHTEAGTPGTGAATIQQVQNIDPLPAAAPRSYGEQMFFAGMESLTKGDKDRAREQFREAWQYESELSPAQRSQLKDKLTLLQPKRLGGQSDKPDSELTPLQKADLEAQQQTRRLFRQVTSELAKAEESKTTKPLDALDQLQRLARLVDQANIDEAAKHSLTTMVERAITSQKQYVEANRAQIDLDLANEAIRSERESDQRRSAQIDDEVSALVDSFNKLMDEQRFHEAEVVAKQVMELSPDHPIAAQLRHVQRTKANIAIAADIQASKEADFLRQMHDIDRTMIGIDPERPMEFGDQETWENITLLRSRSQGDGDTHLSKSERQIKEKLPTPISIKYTNRPLGEVMQDLAAMTGIPIVINHRALAEIGVNSETPITIPQLPDIALQSALNLMLEQLELTHVIDNDVLEITTMESKRSRVHPIVYPVKDLVIPIPNFTSSYDDGLAGALRAAYQMTNPAPDVQLMPVSAVDLGDRMSQRMSPAYMGSDVMGQYHNMGGQGGFATGGSPLGAGGAGGGSFADFDSLMELIQTTVEPETWEELGGPSSMQPYAQNLSLVISTTSEVHDQIVELLESLRRLQNLQITIEVRFITLADSFAEQIGVDFDVQFDDNVSTLPDDDSGQSVVIGFDGISGLPTPDLDIRFENGSFGLAPPFGAGGLGTPSTIGFAILSDIEAFFFLQAAQADNRSNIMQAPKVTMFDGQFATIADVTQRPFVTSIVPVVGDFAVAQQPVIVVLNEGTQLNVQGIVSDDKRFVRLTLVPFFSQIGDVDTFTFEGRRTTRNSSTATTDTDGDGDIDDDDIVEETDEEDIVEGTTVQLPTFASTTVNTTVSVPDGGTILLGGIKRMSEGRVERGVPVLSKIPYVSRLFRNVSAGRDARSLMLMVTPRIIIQEEEELAQTGFDPKNR